MRGASLQFVGRPPDNHIAFHMVAMTALAGKGMILLARFELSPTLFDGSANNGCRRIVYVDPHEKGRPSKILSKVFEYCKKHVESAAVADTESDKTAKDVLKACQLGWSSSFSLSLYIARASQVHDSTTGNPFSWVGRWFGRPRVTTQTSRPSQRWEKLHPPGASSSIVGVLGVDSSIVVVIISLSPSLSLFLALYIESTSN
ncbi:hypothetical protein CRG98_003421 [Punica granatum]|uniref:SKP1 component POZ domain-containing protein n=1 Tax=Punica granatum TaxID=22663 RepID=A0A2I0L678_PUNGR|nr:hypothetical protein CRG98_003421 [Punica granatum]